MRNVFLLQTSKRENEENIVLVGFGGWFSGVFFLVSRAVERRILTILNVLK